MVYIYITPWFTNKTLNFVKTKIKLLNPHLMNARVVLPAVLGNPIILEPQIKYSSF